MSLTRCATTRCALQVFGYTAYLVWSALTSEPVPSTCIRELGKGSTGIKVLPAPAPWTPVHLS